MSRVLVTGGAGFLGSHVVDLLLAEGHEVTVLDSMVEQVHGRGDPDEPVRWPTWRNPGVEYVLDDVRNAIGVHVLLDRIRPHVVVHLAAEVGVGQAERAIERYVDANVRGTAVVLEQILRSNDTAKDGDGVRRVIVAGSMSAYGEGPWICKEHGLVRTARNDDDVAGGRWIPRCPHDGCKADPEPMPCPEWASLRPGGVYAATKRDQEDLALMVGRSSGLSVAVPRFFNLYGPRQALANPYTGVCAIFAGRCLQGLAPHVYEDGGQVRDFVHVSDAARAVSVLVGPPNVRSAMREWSSRTFCGVFNVGTGVATTIETVAQIACDTLAPGVVPVVTGSYRIGDIRACVADVTRIQHDLAWVPSVDVATGLPELFRSWAGTTVVGDLERANREAQAAGLLIGGTAGYVPPDPDDDEQGAAWSDADPSVVGPPVVSSTRQTAE